MITISLAIIMAIITIDQVTKIFLMDTSFVYINNFLYNEPVYNDGAAFSILSGRITFFILFTIVVLGVIGYLLFTNKFSNKKFFKIGLSVLSGGIIGNLLDRYFFESVRDFWYLKPFGFVCNFADVAICVGVLLVCIYILFLHDFKSKKTKLKKSNITNDGANNE